MYVKFNIFILYIKSILRKLLLSLNIHTLLRLQKYNTLIQYKSEVKRIMNWKSNWINLTDFMMKINNFYFSFKFLSVYVYQISIYYNIQSTLYFNGKFKMINLAFFLKYVSYIYYSGM